MTEVYQISASEKIQALEKELALQLAELKTDIEDNGVLHGTPNRAYSSVPKPKDVLYFRKEREMILKRGLQVAGAKPISIQADAMQRELESCLRREYTEDNLPLLLHQFYTDRIHQLVRSKYLHMVRWKRFCRHTSVMEQCYPLYKKQVGFIMQEYSDAVQRAERLAIAREHLMTGQTNSINLVTLEDLIIYLQWLICHLHSMKNIHNYIRTLQHLPISDKVEPVIEAQSKELENQAEYNRFGSIIYNPQDFEEQTGLHVTEEDIALLPQHQTETKQIKPMLRHLLSAFKIEYDVDKQRSTVNEMELLSVVVSKFRVIFSKQQTMRTFPVYDSGMEASDGWGFRDSSMAMKKKANWIPFVKIKPRREPWQQKCLTKLKQLKRVDELLRLQSQFLEVSGAEQVMEILQEHAAHVLIPSPVHAVSGKGSLDIWLKIYSPLDFPQDVNPSEVTSPQQPSGKSLDIVTLNKRPVSSRQKKETGYSYQNTLQLLGLDEAGDNNSKDPVMMKGAYLSFLYLRHLRIRELQRVCLGILNYFRSLQRTLTIDTCCLAGKQGSLVSTAGEESCWVNAAQGGSGLPGGLGSHQYMHYTPADFKVHSTQFMEFSEVENHDDFYTLEDGIMHTQDQRGAYIMYDVALEDLQEIQEELLLMTSCFIGRDKSFLSNKKESKEIDLSDWAHVNVDRFAILLDLWTLESALLENKQQLVDSYYEAYQHALDPEERFALSQVITDIIFRRPRFDVSSNYFLKAYSDECQCLRLHLQIARNVLNSQIENQREFVQTIWRDQQKGCVSEFGLPLNIITKPLVSLNTSSPSLKNVYLLEFHPSLGMAYLISQTLDHICQEFHHISQAKRASEISSIEKHVLQLAMDEWLSMRDPKSTYNANIQKDLFEEVLAEDPLIVKDICISALESADEDKKHGRGKQVFILDTFCKIMELITLRYRLIEASSETAILSRTYTRFAEEMGFKDYHLYLRPVHFEFASHKDQADHIPPMFITAVLEDDSSVDRYTPSSYLLAIHEVDDNQIGKFSFRTREGILQLLIKSGVENLQVALACQVSQKNALLAAVQLASFCRMAPISLQNTDTKLRYGIVTIMITDLKVLNWVLRIQRGLPEAFMSIQLEKVGPRDAMLNVFLQKKQAMGTAMRNPEEVEKIKRELVTDYCEKFNRRTCSYSLRGQIIAYCNSIKHLLEEFPIISKTYFIIGQPRDKKSSLKEAPRADPRIFQKRPHSLLTEDGQVFLNLWYIPYPSEVLAMFKMLPEKAAFRALYQTLQIVASMHDIVSYIFSFAQLGNSCSTYSSHLKNKILTADWGGAEGIGAELQDIQKLIDSLDNPQDPKEVASMLLLRREVMFLQFDAAVRHLIREAFLSAGNVSAYNTTTDNMYHGLPALSNSVVPSAFSTQLPVPLPLDPTSQRTFMLYPWRTFLANGGLFPLTINSLHTIGFHMQMCLCEMTDHERSVAHGELVGVQLLMEDILQSNHNFISFTIKGDKEDRLVSAEFQTPGDRQQETGPGTTIHLPSAPHDPISVFKLLRSFLILWKQLEVCKENWGKQRLRVEKVNTTPIYKQFCELYRDEIFYPTMKAIAKKMGKEEEFEGLALRSQVVLPPKGASDVETRIWQLHKLLEYFESHMIHEVQKKTAKEMTLVMAERTREEGGLPTELWQQTVMKETFSPIRPQSVEKFVQKLMSEHQDNTSEVTFRKDHLEDCLTSLACDIMERERSNFDTYSMFYENLLRQEHQLLYQKEQEMLAVDGEQRQSEENLSKTAELSHELIIEITALRAKLSDLEEEALATKERMKKEVQEEYEALVRTLFEACVSLKAKLDEYHINMNKQVCELISDARKEGVDDMIILKRKYGSTKDDNALRNNLTTQEKLQSLRDENSCLQALVSKLKALNHWKTTAKEGQLREKIRDAKKEAVQCKKESLKLKLIMEQEMTLLRQQLMVARTALTKTQAENSIVKQQLSKQKEQLNELEHRLSQETRSRQHLEAIKSASMDKLMEDLEEKEHRLLSLAEEAERFSKMSQLQQNKINREVKQIKSQLMQERNLKLDAFQRVDELQTQVYDLEMTSSLRNSPVGEKYQQTMLRVQKVASTYILECFLEESCACLLFVYTSWAQMTKEEVSPCHIPQCKNSIGSLPAEINASNRVQIRLQRPKTVPSRCRNRVSGTVSPELANSTCLAILTKLQEL
ncbi:uncharacterized protein WCC33_002830 [Rhinophrynus dorsalis]